MQETAFEELREVDITRISVNPFQPRHHFSQAELEELSASIVSVGLIHPPVVRACGDGHYELVAGERRFRAAQLAGFTSIPVLIRNHTSAHSAQAALIENLQRVDLNPIEIAKALRNLAEEFKWSQEELSKRIGKKRSTVANYMRLLALPKNIQDSLSRDLISMGHAKAILSVEGFEKQNVLHDRVVREGLTVRETERAAERLGSSGQAAVSREDYSDPHLVDLMERLQQKLGTKVSVQGKGQQGKITIDYYSLDDLDRLLQIFNI